MLNNGPELVFDLVDREPVRFERMVLARLLLDRPFALRAATILFADRDGQEARSFQMPKHAGLARAIMLYHGYNAPTTPPAWEFLQGCLDTTASNGLLPLSEMNDIWQYFYQTIIEAQASWEMIINLTNIALTYWVKKVRCDMITSKSKAERWRIEQLQDALRRENSHVDKITKEEKMQFDIWEVLLNPQPDTIRLRTSLARLNVVMGGGFGYGEGYLLIAASGAGKSVATTQLASEWALQSKKVAIVTTERSQGTLPLSLRIISQHCNIPYGQIVNGLNPQALQPSQQQALQEFRQRVNEKNLRVIEWWKMADTSSTGLESEIMKAAEFMGGLDAFFLDWVGGALGEQFKTDEKKLRLIYQQSADMVPRLAGDLSVIGVATAQAQNTTGKNKARVDATHLQECKTMDRDMTGVCGISAIQDKEQDSSGFGANYTPDQFWYVSKSRKGEGGLVPVTRKFAYQKFVDRTGTTPSTAR